MATKKKENAVPEIIDNVEALEAKMKAMREWQQIRCVSRLLRWQ